MHPWRGVARCFRRLLIMNYSKVDTRQMPRLVEEVRLFLALLPGDGSGQ